MWRAYHKVCTSEQFRLLWINVLSEVKVQSVVPAFYQAVTDAIFKEMIVVETAVEEPQLQPVQPITYMKVPVSFVLLLVMCVEEYMKR